MKTLRSDDGLSIPSHTANAYSPMNDVTQILHQVEQGDSAAAEQLLPLVYDELRKLATAKLAQEKPGQTLQATALVHDAYIRLVDANCACAWDSRGHFFSAAAEAMRRILVEAARAKAAQKRGSSFQQIDLSNIRLAALEKTASLLDLDEALQELQQMDRQAARLVELRFFAGLTMDEAAEILGISARKAYHVWDYGRAWLRRKLRASEVFPTNSENL